MKVNRTCGSGGALCDPNQRSTSVSAWPLGLTELRKKHVMRRVVPPNQAVDTASSDAETTDVPGLDIFAPVVRQEMTFPDLGVVARFWSVFESHKRGYDGAIPTNLADALFVFFAHPTCLLIAAGLTGLGGWRFQSGGFGWLDVFAFSSVACWWVLQEWIVHRWLFHSSFKWMGSEIHEGHHRKGYYHISIDSSNIVGGMMLLSFIFFSALCVGSPVGLTATWTYWLMGFLYEWNHYLSHTRYAPKWEPMRSIKRNHMLHHFRSEHYWLSFTVPQVDMLFGTAPNPKDVPKTNYPQKTN